MGLALGEVEVELELELEWRDGGEMEEVVEGVWRKVF